MNNFPTMPKQMKPFKKGQQIKQNRKIRIVAPVMTLTGFEHDKKNIEKKNRLIARAITGKRHDEIEVKSKRSGRSKSSRKSSIRASSKHQPDDEDDEDSHLEDASDIEQPPMNEDIESLEHESENYDNQAAAQPQTRFEALPPGAPTEALNPRSYAFVPSNWTQRIRAAGSKTNMSEYVGAILHQPVYDKKEERAPARHQTSSYIVFSETHQPVI